MNEPAFRLATAADSELLLQFMREYYAYDGHAFDENRARTALLAFLREPLYGFAWIVLDGDSPVGYVVLTFGYSLEYLGRDAFVDEFYLRDAYRGRGWGRKTLEFVEQEARAREIRALHLEVVRKNTAAGAFYRRAGFVDHDHHLMSKWIEPRFDKPGKPV
jgi:GNAT superfamily N-acetyltransferase